ncbi:MAG: DUF3291 domain-containing protein [Aurantibacter sp.]
MKNYNLAQVNIAKMLAPTDSPIMADFMNNLDRINALAEQSAGFIWRMKEENNNAMEIKVFDDDFIVINMSIWESIETLFDFTYRSQHVEIFKRKKEWFHKMSDMHMALWYIPSGHIPSTDEAKERLNYLNANGESPYAFTFRSEFTSEDSLNYQTQT